MNLHSDQRGLVAGWAVKLCLFLALLGIVLYDGAAIAVNAFQLDGISKEIAVDVSESAERIGSLVILERSAQQLAMGHGAHLVRLELSRNREVLRVTVTRDANTLVVKRFSETAPWGEVSSTGKALITGTP